MRRFDPNTVQDGHIYSTMKEDKVFISSFSVGYAEDFSYGRDEPWGKIFLFLVTKVTWYFCFSQGVNSIRGHASSLLVL